MTERKEMEHTLAESIPAISIIMSTYNVGTYIQEAIDSIIRQSFTNFECIIIDEGSTDNTLDIIRSYDDSRIILYGNDQDNNESLNLGMTMVQGKYIARMGAAHRMHPDRLKIQFTIMETEPTIAVCSTWMQSFGQNVSEGRIANSLSGCIEFPLLSLLHSNFVFYSTTMIRKHFLEVNNLSNESYLCAEDFKLWIEIAKKGGIFYIENQPLLYYRVFETQVAKQEELLHKIEELQLEIIEYFIAQNKSIYPSLVSTHIELLNLYREGLIEHRDMIAFFYRLFHANKRKLETA